jgi:acyl-coenzyme A synthetase/AMP-(fatty) acid ligase
MAHRGRILFTTDEPCLWRVPSLSNRYPDRYSWSAERIEQTAGYVAAALLGSFKLERGDRVALFKTNHFDMHVLMCGIVRAGGVACPINGRFAAEKLHPYLANIGARILISDIPVLLRALSAGADLSAVEYIILAGDRAQIEATSLDVITRGASHARIVWIEDALSSVDREASLVARQYDDAMYLVHSSGTTGFPKAVTLKNGAQSHAVRGWLSYVHLSPSRDKGYMAVPDNHQAVILSFNSLLLLGLPAHWIGGCDRESFNADKTAAELDAGAYTGFFGFPVTYTMLNEIPRERARFNRMRFWATTADASHEAMQKQFVSRGGLFKSIGLPFAGSVFLDAQGSSEVGTPSVLRYISRFTRKFERRIGRAGSTPFGPALRITTPAGEPVAQGSVGRLEVKGKTVFDSYWNDPEMTAIAFRDGWFFTGDVARLDGDGNFIQLDREVDVIHTRAGDVYSLLIEEELHKHDAIYDACVFGARQKDGTQLPAAWIAVRAGCAVTPGRLLEELNMRLPVKSALSHVEIHDWNEFPMGITGKTLKRVLAHATEPSAIPERNRPRGFEIGSNRHFSAAPASFEG